jgi:hypothetical protein
VFSGILQGREAESYDGLIDQVGSDDGCARTLRAKQAQCAAYNRPAHLTCCARWLKWPRRRRAIGLALFVGSVAPRGGDGSYGP